MDGSDDEEEEESQDHFGPYANEADVVDCFYNYSVEELGSWFILGPDPPALPSDCCATPARAAAPQAEEIPESAPSSERASGHAGGRRRRAGRPEAL